jgi:hypothetical protein
MISPESFTSRENKNALHSDESTESSFPAPTRKDRRDGSAVTKGACVINLVWLTIGKWRDA